ncbi:alkaline phosphatase family protein [Bdellovibrionota bacterium FG-2]
MKFRVLSGLAVGVSLLFVFGSLGSSSLGHASPKRPKLIVMLVVDQFRADYLQRFEKRFLPPLGKDGRFGGFRYLMSKGAYYPQAHYDLLQCMTGPGHASVLTGAYPYQAGIGLNDWFDRETGSRVNCAEDRSVSSVGATVASPHAGTSPRNLWADTVGDELKNAGYPARVFSISLKDRSAIFMGGHRADAAFWFNPESFSWISSRYYFPQGELPAWIKDLNSALQKEKGKPFVWEPKGKAAGFSIDEKGHFPHSTTVGEKAILMTPYGLEMTLEISKKALDVLHLGEGPSSDLLAVSFSSHDYAGHAYGPNSREMEEMTVVEDRILSDFLNHLNVRVPGGLANVLVAFTADHGVAPFFEEINKQDRGHLPGMRVVEEEVTQAVSEKLIQKFGKPGSGEWVLFNHEWNIFLNSKAALKKGIDPVKLQVVAKEAILNDPRFKGAFAFVFTAHEYVERKLPPGILEQQILHSYIPERSGDVVMIPRPFVVPKNFDSTSHLTGYSYDRTVPLILLGTGIRSGIYSASAGVVDIAPTLSFLAGVLPPAMTEGRVLSEALLPGKGE